MRSAKRVRMPHAARRTPHAASRPTRARASRAKAGDGRKRKEARALVLPSSCVAFRLRSAQSFLKRSSNSSESSWHRKGGGNHQENGVRKERACHHEGDLRVRVGEGWEEEEGGGGEGCGWGGGSSTGTRPAHLAGELEPLVAVIVHVVHVRRVTLGVDHPACRVPHQTENRRRTERVSGADAQEAGGARTREGAALL